MSERPRRIDDIPRLQAARRPAVPALAQGPVRWSYAEWAGAVDTAAAGLAARGLGPGDRMAIVAENGLVLATLIMAASRCGAWPMPLNARLSAAELDSILDHSGARLAAFASDVSPDAARHAERLGATPERWDAVPGFALAARQASAPEAVADDPAVDVGALLYTSGTTGAPKGVMLTHRNLLHNAEHIGPLRGLGPGERVFGLFPLSHVAGLATMFLATAWHGATLHLVARFDPGAALTLVESEKLTVLPVPPAGLARILEHVRATGRRLELPALRYVSTGSSPLDITLKRDVEALFGVALYNAYGLTEMGPMIATTHARAPRPDTSVGLPFPGVEIRIVGPDGRPVALGAVGLLKARGPNVMRGYYRAPEATRAAIDEEGWLDTGDLARQDADGALFIAGRAKELIIRSGFNVYPEEVEAALAAHPAVMLAAVVGRPAAAGNEEVIAFVQLAPGAAAGEEALRAWCAERLAPYKRPARIVALDALPASATGKIRKAPLRERAREIG